jgi:hypothetical protein
MLPDGSSETVLGFSALGREGELGVVVGVHDRPREPRIVVVRGGVSNALTYYVPMSRLRNVSRETATLELDVALGDFTPHLREDGTVELRA